MRYNCSRTFKFPQGNSCFPFEFWGKWYKSYTIQFWEQQIFYATQNTENYNFHSNRSSGLCEKGYFIFYYWYWKQKLQFTLTTIIGLHNTHQNASCNGGILTAAGWWGSGVERGIGGASSTSSVSCRISASLASSSSWAALKSSSRRAWLEYNNYYLLVIFLAISWTFLWVVSDPAPSVDI